MTENYPVAHALSYEFWAYATLHPFQTFFVAIAILSIIGWLAKD